MNTAKILKSWGEFKKFLPEVDRRDRLMKLNFEFELSENFHKEDLDKMLIAVDKCINSIRVIDKELPL